MTRIIALLLLFIAPDLFAANLFDPSPTDESMKLLSLIFGPDVGSIYLGNLSSNNTAIAGMMQKFNLIIVAMATSVLGYVGVVSTIHTAHEGSVLGKSWSALWVPIRSIAGIGLLVPLPATGYCLIQVGVMWLIVQSIGAADMIWTQAMQSLTNGIGMSTAINPGDTARLKIPAEQLTQSILDAQICMQLFNKQANDTSLVNNPIAGLTAKAYSVQSPSSAFLLPQQSTTTQTNATGAKATGTMYFGVPGDPLRSSVCGSIAITGEADKSEYPTSSSGTVNYTGSDFIQSAQLIYDSKLQAINQMLGIMYPLAVGYITSDFNSYPPPSSTNSGSPTPAGLYINAVNAYTGSLSKAAVPGFPTSQSGTITGAAIQNNSSTTQAALQAAEENGWIVAGSYYFVINQTMFSKLFASAFQDLSLGAIQNVPDCNSNCQQKVYTGNEPDFTDVPPDTSINGFITNSSIYNSLLSMGFTQDNVHLLSMYLAWGSQYLLQDSKTTMPTTAFGTANSPQMQQTFASVSNLDNDSLSALTNAFQTINNGGDALLTLSNVGFVLMALSEATWAATLVTPLTFSIISSICSSIIGWLLAFFGAGPRGLKIGSEICGEGLMEMLLGLVSYVSGLAATVWTFGAMLAIYMPLIPFMIFSFTALGWFLMVLEAMIAAPIMALGLIIPAGDELGKVKHSLEILANILFRPTLMIFGFLIAGRVFTAVITLVNFSVGSVFTSINIQTMFSLMVVLGVYTTFLLSMANLSFSIIYALPDKFFRWIGGKGEHTDVSALSEVKDAVKSAASQTSKDVGAGTDSLNRKGAKKMLEKKQSKSGGTP